MARAFAFDMAGIGASGLKHPNLSWSTSAMHEKSLEPRLFDLRITLPLIDANATSWCIAEVIRAAGTEKLLPLNYSKLFAVTHDRTIPFLFRSPR